MVTAPRFPVGASVRVSGRRPCGHMRTPAYIRGLRGVIERYCGTFRDPESLAYGGDGLPERGLYRVRFSQGRLWAGYGGSAADTLEIEIYDHWLDPADPEATEDGTDAP